MTAQTLGKTRAIQTRVTEEEGERLDRIAQIEGCSVADLARRALRQVFPQAFLLPINGTNGADMEREHHTTPDNGSVSGETPTSAPPALSNDGAVSNGRTSQAAR